MRATSRANENGKMTIVRLRASSAAVMHGEGDEQQVAGEHVGEEPDRERERPGDEDRDELDRRHQDVDRPSGTPGGKHDVLEVADEALVLDADEVVDHPDQQRQEHRQRDAGVHRHLDDRDDLPDVADEDEAEQRQQERRVTEAVRARSSAG